MIVGRDDELSRVDALVRGAAGASALLLQGDAGIGKTTLLTAAIAGAAEQGLPVLTCRPTAMEAGMSFAALGDLLEPALRGGLDDIAGPRRRALEAALLLSDAGDSPPDAHAIGLAVADAITLSGKSGPVLVAIDDAHWLDPASADALAFGLRRVSPSVLRLIVALRTPHAIPLALDRWADLEQITLGGLSLGALHRMVSDRLGATLSRPALRRIAETSGGNPLFALELARSVLAGATDALGRDVPTALEPLLDERLAALPPETDDALAVAASTPSATVARIGAAGVPDVESALAPAVRAGVCEISGGSVRFTHPLLAARAAARPDVARRREIHRSLAAVADDPEERGRHLAHAASGPDEPLADALDVACDHAAARGATDAAAEFAETSLEFTPPGDALAMWRRILRAAELHSLTGDTNRYRELLERALLFPDLPADLRADALCRMAYTTNDYDRAGDYCRQAISASKGDPGRSSEAHRVYAEVLLIQGDVDAATDHARRAAGFADAANDRGRLARCLGDVALYETYAGTISEGVLERALALEESEADLQLDYPPSAIAGLRLAYFGRYDEARDHLERLEQRARTTGDEMSRGAHLLALADLEIRAAGWPRAARLAREGLELAEQAGLDQWRAAFLATSARVQALRGQADETRRNADQAMRVSAEVGDTIFAGQAMAALASLALGEGAMEVAAEHLRDLVARVRSAGYREPAVRGIHLDAIEAFVGVGDLDAARELVADLDVRAAAAPPSPWATAAALHGHGLLRVASGDAAGGADMLREALVAHEAFSGPFERARVLMSLGVAERRAKRRRAARLALDEAHAEFVRLGADLWALRADSERQRIGGRVGGRDELSATERRVAELVGRGRANREVAAELSVSVRAVEANLTRIYAKLGVKSRAQLIARLGADTHD